MHGIENIVRGGAQLERAGFFDLDRLVERHAHRNLPRPLDDISSGVAKTGTVRVGAGGARRAKRRRIEPFERGWVAYRNGLPRDDVCAKRSAHTSADVQPSSQHARCEVQSGSDHEVTAPLPSPQNVAQCTLGNKPPAFAEWQIQNPVSREFVSLVEAGKSAVGEDKKWILRHNAPPASDRGRVIDGLRKHVLRT